MASKCPHQKDGLPRTFLFAAVLLQWLFKRISYHEREIVKLRFGLGDSHKYKLEEVAHILKITTEEAATIEKNAIDKLVSLSNIHSATRMIKKKVLYVEDDESLAAVVEYNLLQNNFVPLITHTGQQGFQLATSELPDLIVVDLMLPDMDGNDLIGLLSRSHKTQHIPIVVLTAKAEESDELIGFGIGVQDYITKPFSIKVLFARLRAILKHRARVQPTSNPNTAMTVNPVFNIASSTCA